MRHIVVNWHEVGWLVVAVILVAGGTLLAWLCSRKDPAEIERERRAYLNRIGRIVEGRIVEVVEQSRDTLPAPGSGLFRRERRTARGRNGTHKLVFYSYSMSGVTYETAQDVTGFEERVCLDRVAAGQPASVKCDPSNPSNSILIADDWSGLH